ncbi:MAG: hypothetical protein RR404_00410 [Bacilli bacterium]
MKITQNQFNKLAYINEGEEGIVRRKDGLALKQMWKNEFPQYKKDSIDYQMDLISDSFIFPIDRLYISGLYAGYVQKFLDKSNPTLSDLNNLRTTLILIRIVEKNISVLNDNKIKAGDLLKRNCLFDNAIIIIDTSKFTYEKNRDSYEIMFHNISKLSRLFTNLLFIQDDIPINLFIDFLKTSEATLKSYFRLVDTIDLELFSQFLLTFMKEFNFQTIEEYRTKILSFKKFDLNT